MAKAVDPPTEHKTHAPHSVRCFVLTVSDTKTPDTDTSGATIRELLVAGGHQVAGSALVRDEPTDVQRVVRHSADTARRVLHDWRGRLHDGGRRCGPPAAPAPS